MGCPVTTEEKAQKKNDVKARSMLLMALPNEHLITFNQYKDSQTLFAAIQIRFGGNEATKKTQKTLLKQMLQKIVSQLAILGENISQEDLNLKFLRSLPFEWNTRVVVWRNKPDLNTNMAFVSSPSSTNEVNTAYGVSTANTQVNPASTQVSTASTQVNTANLSDDTVYAFLSIQPNGSQLVYEDLEQIHKDDIEEMDLKCSRRTVNVEETSSKAMVAIDGAGFDWSYLADEEVLTNMALMAFLDFEFNKSEFNLATSKRGLTSVEEHLVFYKKNEVIFCEQLVVLKRDISYKDSEISMLKNKLIGSQISDKSRKGVGFVSYNVVPPPPTRLFSPQKFDLSNSGLEDFQQPEFKGYGPKPSKSFSEDTSNKVRESPDASLVEKLVSDDKLEKKTSYPPAHCNYHQREMVESRNNYTRVNYNYYAKKTHPSAHRNMVPRSVLMKTSLKSLNTVRPVNTAHSKTIVYSARPMSYFSKSAQSTVKSPYQIRTSLTNKFFSQKVNTAKGKSYTARPKAVDTVRPNSAVVNIVRANQVNDVKALACWVWRPTKLNSASITLKRHNYVDARGRSKSGMAWVPKGNYLSDFKEFDRGYVTFEEGAKGGKITSKGTLKIDKLDLKDVYFVKEL
ncbi:hypothetical protein Tco_0784709 [Tanacetum coccineum]